MANLKTLIRGLATLGFNIPELVKLASLKIMISKPSSYRFFDKRAVSCGWISPDGEYFFNGSGHYELALLIWENHKRDRFREIVRVNPEAGLDDINYIIFKEMLRDGWVKISNASEIECEAPTRASIDAFVSLFLSYDKCPMDMTIFLNGKGYELLFSGDILEAEKWANRLA